ncbi:AraC family transcriptional regulator of adaptative response / DNA-3-methyladenine glycosylase II [Sphingopyxis sp. OAS728]|uniref:bifunctional transcriptional activator/DNA repair enzyme AdaA n=1 Tax=Sphingopyxis sp. OAS728 TaxID=2663823 RepID=UPI00178A19AE|nr:bifunctional transcriptional activator/DNA repair enzyme AdaA [Sphingopyxis sp. OAS728]MBE1528941.1 AraC family transcriptional regulator of adaptative response / DNA-3-methyladenine glycosylase II [Sphingopyxis sp. OAS728]
MLDDDACYSRLARRDPAADGEFFVAVKTTGIYCRPICPARLPLRQNVSFFRTAAAAHANGYRPCLRCRPESAPDSPAWLGTLASVRRALNLIDNGFLVDRDVDALADTLGMTARHLRRLFMKHLGVGPMAVEQVRRLHLAKKLMHETALPITEIAFAAGYGSLRRFNEVFLKAFKRPPSSLRRKREVNSSAAPLAVSIALRPDSISFPTPDQLALEVGTSASALIRSVKGSAVTVELVNIAPKDIAAAISEIKQRLHGHRPGVAIRQPPLAAPAGGNAGNQADGTAG